MAGSVNRNLAGFKQLRVLAMTLMWAMLLSPPAAAEGNRVDMLLVLAIDSSGSTRNGDFLTQIRGHATAFRDPRVVKALTSGRYGRIAAAVIVWSDDAQQWRCVNWMAIASAADATRFADKISRCPFIGGGTSIGGALRNARNELGWSPFQAKRRVIDISANERSAWVVEPARLLAVREGITINALVLDSPDDSLVPYFSRFVIGGPGAFVVTATPEVYAESLSWKLRVETAGLSPTAPPGGIQATAADAGRGGAR